MKYLYKSLEDIKFGRTLFSCILEPIKNWFNQSIKQGHIKNFLLQKYYMVPKEFLLKNIEIINEQLEQTSNKKTRHHYLKHLNYRLSTNIESINNVKKIFKYASLETAKNKKFLDIGCGVGGFCFSFQRKGYNFKGIDINPLMINLAKLNIKNFKSNFYCLDVSDKNFFKKFRYKFDIITCSQVIEHVKDKETFIKNISNLMNKKAICFIDVPNGYSLNSVISDPHLGLMGLTLLSLENADEYVWHILDRDDYPSFMGGYIKLNECRTLFKKYGLIIKEYNRYDIKRIGEVLKELDMQVNNLETKICSLNKKSFIENIVYQKIVSYIQQYKGIIMQYEKTKDKKLAKRIIENYYFDSFDIVLEKK